MRYGHHYKGSRRLLDMGDSLSQVMPLPIAVKTSKHMIALGGYDDASIAPRDEGLTEGELRTVREAADRVIAQHRSMYIELVMLLNPKEGLGVLDGVAAEDILVNSLNDLGDRMATRLPKPGPLAEATMEFTVKAESGNASYLFRYERGNNRRQAWVWDDLEPPETSIRRAYYLARNFGAFMRWYTEVSIQLSRLNQIDNTIKSA